MSHQVPYLTTVFVPGAIIVMPSVRMLTLSLVLNSGVFFYLTESKQFGYRFVVLLQDKPDPVNR